MPVYDYKCKDCEHVFEVFHKIADSGPTECPECKQNNVFKLMSPIMGSVELRGQELSRKIKADAQKLIQESSKSQKVLANMVGDDKFHNNQLLNDTIKKEDSYKD